MTGSFVIRSGEGALVEHPIRTRCTIGSSAPSDLVLDGAAILPLHATVEVVDGRYWIAAAGGGSMAINGQPADRHALRHLDVITLGAAVHLIFSTKMAAPRDTRTTQVVKHTDLMARPIAPPAAGKTVHGVPVAAFKPKAPSATASFNVPIGARQPPFTPEGTQTTKGPVVPPPFAPNDTQVLGAPVGRTIASIRLQGPDGVYEARLGASVIGRGGKATIRIEQPEVSRTHAMLIVTPSDVTIEDLGSTRGTAVNGTRVTGMHPLSPGDVVTIGKLDLRVEIIYAGGAP